MCVCVCVGADRLRATAGRPIRGVCGCLCVLGLMGYELQLFDQLKVSVRVYVCVGVFLCACVSGFVCVSGLSVCVGVCVYWGLCVRVCVRVCVCLCQGLSLCLCRGFVCVGVFQTLRGDSNIQNVLLDPVQELCKASITFVNVNE